MGRGETLTIFAATKSTVFILQVYHVPVHPKLSVGACNTTLIAILGIFETSEKKVLAEKKVLVGDGRRVGSPAVDADLLLTNLRPYTVHL